MDNHTISHVTAREILDSRGNPTVEVDLFLENGAFGRAAVPSGASTGSHEAVELRDGGTRYGGKGVWGAVENVKAVIAPAITGHAYTQEQLDHMLIELDGTPNKSRLGANAVLGVSLAYSHAAAARKRQPLYHYFAEISGNEKLLLPVPMMNILNGGRHAAGSTDLQEFMIIPAGAPNFREALRYGVETFHALQSLLKERGFSTAVGDEGGFAPPLASNEQALEVIVEAISRAGFQPGHDIFLAIDAAASELYENGLYRLASEGKTLTADELITVYSDWADRYPLLSLEDGLQEDDWDGYTRLTEQLGTTLQLVGDDLFVTNVDRLKMGIEKKAGNAILIKLNQIGTVTETINAITMARQAGMTAIVSHRSGETEDTTIADFVVGLGTGQIKTGSLSRTERVAKYNQLLRIEEELGEQALFPGLAAFYPKDHV